MGKLFFDLTSGKHNIEMGNKMMMNPDGKLLIKTSKNTALDMDSGELHILASTGDDDE